MIGYAELALRNVVRNLRRSIPTLAAVALGTFVILFFFGFTHYAIGGLQTVTVRNLGHLEAVVPGYLEFGGGNATRFSIADYQALETLIGSDSQLRPLTSVVTPMLDIQGVASSLGGENASMFRGQAWVPAERARMFAWDGHAMGIPPAASALGGAGGAIGFGLAQILGLCPTLHLSNCRLLPTAAPARDAARTPADLTALSPPSAPGAAVAGASVDLLAASPGGLPNIVRMPVLTAERQPVRDVDNLYVSAPLLVGQRLMFGPGVVRASAIVVQLKQTEQLDAARTRLRQLLALHHIPLDVLSFHDVSPIYDQVVGSYDEIFFFLSVLMGLVTLFSVTNTVNMAVAERTVEIGTLRALGFRRGAVALIFIFEGGLLGLVGTLAGAGLALAVAGFINGGDYSWTPPGNGSAVPLHVDVAADPALIWRTILLLSLLACLAALVPAIRASRMDVVRALRHA